MTQHTCIVKALEAAGPALGFERSACSTSPFSTLIYWDGMLTRAYAEREGLLSTLRFAANGRILSGEGRIGTLVYDQAGNLAHALVHIAALRQSAEKRMYS